MPLDDENERDPFYGEPLMKLPEGGARSPLNPGAAIVQSPRAHGRSRGNYNLPGNYRGSRGLLIGDTDKPGMYDREQPPDFVGDVDLDNWFSPGQPVTPFGPPYVNYPRTWDYPTFINVAIFPQRLNLYSLLRGLARGSGVITLEMEGRIDELVALPWKFALKNPPKGKKSEDDPRVKELTQFFLKPDRKIPYAMWMRMIFRDRYTIDAASAFIWKNRLQNKPYAIIALDGATVKPLVDDYGRIPDFPQPAYQQIVKGLPMDNYHERELLYMPARPRTDCPIFGFSEVEQIMMEATQVVRKGLYMLNFWKEGNVPDVMFGVPEGWTPEQIAIWQATFDAILSGNLKLKSKIRFIPSGMQPFEMKGSAGELLKSTYDEWMTRIVCRAFRTLPKPYIQEPASRSSVESEKQQIQQQGIEVEMVWWKSFMDALVQMGWGWDDLELVWNQDEEVDIVNQQTVLTGYVKTAQLTLNESRERQGLDPVEGGDVPMVYTSGGAIPFKVLAAQTEMPQAGGAGAKGDEDGKSSANASGETEAGKAAGVPFGKRGKAWSKY